MPRAIGYGLSDAAPSSELGLGRTLAVERLGELDDQRKLSVVEAHGGVKLLVKLAKKHGVHLVRLTDDKGNELVAASKHPFKVLR